MPYLIAMTPRAGRWNHRYLVPPNLNLSTVVLGRLTGMAGQQPQGPAWLAISHEVQQVGGSRLGQEMLILGDLDVQRLNPEARESIQECLRQRLLDLGELITQEADWEHEGRVDPVIRSELAQWYAVDFQPLGLLESRAPDWNLTSVISMKEHKATKEDKENNESKRFWLIGSAVGGVGILLATIFYLIKPQIVPVNNLTKVDDVVCEISGVKPGGKDLACLLSKNEFKRLCDIFISPSNKCEPRDIETPFREIQGVRKNVDFPAIVGRSHNDGSFDSALLLTENKTAEDVRVLTEEIFGVGQSGGRKISFAEYISVLKYEDKIKKAWDALKAFDPKFPFSDKSQQPPYSWRPVDYDNALRDIRRFLNELPEKMEMGRGDYLSLFLARPFFDVGCFRKEANNNTSINSRLKCFVQKDRDMQENPDWEKLKSNKGMDQASDRYKSINLFEAILELRSPLPSP
jgi:hypothetical protein